MAIQTQMKIVKVVGHEWVKLSDRAPYKITAMDGDTTVSLVLWGKTYPGDVVNNESYEIEIGKITDDAYGIQYTLTRNEDHGPAHMILSSTKEKIKPKVGLIVKDYTEHKIKILKTKWYSKDEYTHQVLVRDLSSETLEDCKLLYHGQFIPSIIEGADYLVLVKKQQQDDKIPYLIVITESNSIPKKFELLAGNLITEKFKFPVKPPAKKKTRLLNKLEDKIINLSTKKNTKKVPKKIVKDKHQNITKSTSNIIIPKKSDNRLTDVALSKIILDALQSDSLNYVPGYKTYRASSVNSCARKILLKKWEKDLSSTQQKLVNKLRRQYDYDRKRLGATWAGTALHEFVENVLKKSDIYISSEEKITIELEEITFVGHYDLLLEINGQRYVVDTKTTNQKWEGTQYEFKLEEHFNQLNIYQHKFGGLPGLILYVQRNDGKITVFQHEYSAAKFDKTVNLFKQLSEYEQRHELPMIPSKFSEDGFPCKKGEMQCEYWYVCWRPSQ